MFFRVAANDLGLYAAPCRNLILTTNADRGCVIAHVSGSVFVKLINLKK